MAATARNVAEIPQDPSCNEDLSSRALMTWVADNGYHSNETMRMTAELGLTTYISELERGQRHWKDEDLARRGTYDNRRRIRGERGNQLRRRCGELLERSFAHTLETGGMRGTQLRGHQNNLKRYLVHVAAFNPGLVMRAILRLGTPRGLQGRLGAALDAFAAVGSRATTLLVVGCDLMKPKPQLRPIAQAA